MGLIEKIEEIRKKPEHIKLLYVWFFVILCMILIVAIWFFSLKADLNEISKKDNQTNRESSALKQSGSELLEEISKQKDAMQNTKTTATPNENN